MKILLVHNSYQQSGGEDTVVFNEINLLRDAGHDVRLATLSNDNITGNFDKLSTALQTPYSFSGRRFIKNAILGFQPDIVHVHNHFPRLSPSIFDACDVANVPVVWTLHNFRIFCANGLLFRDGNPCASCIGHSSWPAVTHKCYRDSSLGSLVVASLIEMHKKMHTWQRKVSRFIALNEFAREVLIRGGLPSDRVVVKPNFCPAPNTEFLEPTRTRSGAVFVGRLSTEKGINVLIEAWKGMNEDLTIIGDGPERGALESAASSNVQFVGFLELDAVLDLMSSARLIIVPSLWYETFGLVAIEAMSVGTPVIASDIGALSEIINNDVNGLLFRPGDVSHLSEVLAKFFTDAKAEHKMRLAARSTYLNSYSQSANIKSLEEIYNSVIREHNKINL